MRWKGILPLAAATTLVLASTVGLAQEPAANSTTRADARGAASQPEGDRYSGHYRYAGSRADGRERIMNAARPHIRRLNPIVRPLAEAYLSGRDVPPRIDLNVQDGNIAVRFVRREEEPRMFRSRVGRPQTVTGDDGQESEMTQLFRQGQLQQIFESDRGRWYNLFELDESGQHLRLELVITSRRLPQPFRLELPYVRTR